MIVRREGDQWEIIKQHDHAYLSFQIASHWKRDAFPHPDLKQDVLYAIRHHDRAWIPLDQQVVWNAADQKPYDFTNYPLEEKLLAYSRGIDQVAEQTTYGAILCSIHYASFFATNKENNPTISSFLYHEQERRRRLTSSLTVDSLEDVIHSHYRILQFCDDLSLYATLNPPGASKSEEIEWFKEGFRQEFCFAPQGMTAKWLTDTDIQVKPYPFSSEFEVEVPTVRVSRDPSQAVVEWKNGYNDQRVFRFSAG
ncbi:DUF3891 family protein [Sediminibacillus dalangtanensis]|uniref:DUF3891 family protein n=1 Tax=Sediminibacillus dalangtanensis TaxID=2729421 RepID=A0ABX7VXF7_9BACI|nr:DUF3891 family protein [Sediminibacillus dalangtanensis]QTN01224.1 DUF3891 family protein [Sediminibacillus dalangtanensis]